MDLGLEDKVVVVTGATGGIGSAICEAFVRERSVLVPLYRTSLDKLRHLLEGARAGAVADDRIAPVEMELTDAESVSRGVEGILERFGRIDVLVNCAGFSHELPFLLTEQEQWEEVMDVNLSSVARLTRLIVKQMFRARSGSVVNVASVLGSRFGRGNVAYAVTKAGIIRFTQALAQEVGPRGVRVNAVCPGVIETSMSQNLTRRLDGRLRDMTPLGRVGQPQEVGPAVLFLASERTASFITGTTLVVDGGITI
jgi:3-oxoacyl-[acyl-carrier protein] reductase